MAASFSLFLRFYLFVYKNPRSTHQLYLSLLSISRKPKKIQDVLTIDLSLKFFVFYGLRVSGVSKIKNKKFSGVKLAMYFGF